jgi:hypothetical protein
MISDSGRPGWVVDRVEFEKVIARQAAADGADIAMNPVSLLSLRTVTRSRVLLSIRRQDLRDGCKVVIARRRHPLHVLWASPKRPASRSRGTWLSMFKSSSNGSPVSTRRPSRVYFGPFTNGEFCFVSPIGKDSAYVALGSIDQYEKAPQDVSQIAATA